MLKLCFDEPLVLVGEDGANGSRKKTLHSRLKAKIGSTTRPVLKLDQASRQLAHLPPQPFRPDRVSLWANSPKPTKEA